MPNLYNFDGFRPYWKYFRMGGVFMLKLVKRVFFCLLLVCLVWVGTLLADRQKLNQELIRLHVVANSDSDADQKIKLKVRDAITDCLSRELSAISDVHQAKAYLQENLPKIEQLANQVLLEAGVEPTAVVSLCQEAFDIRDYDSFRLPSGIYHALRIVIGEGLGRNWWCVVYPSFCTQSAAFEDTAVEAGMSDPLTASLKDDGEYNIRFLGLDILGKLENYLFRG